MSENSDNSDSNPKMPRGGKGAAGGRAALSLLGGAIPFAGGLFSAMAGHWSEREQQKINDFLEHWLKMLSDEMAEKQQTVIEVMARLDIQDEAISKRIESKEFQSLVKKTFREWSVAESEEKRIYVRNILSNAASSSIVSDDVIRMFLAWLRTYSEMHFHVITAIYNSSGITRGQIWRKIGNGPVREDSAEADLYKLLIRDLSMGSIIRQHRPTDYHGNFIRKPKSASSNTPGKLVSAFDDNEGYELTSLGNQFVHYAMTEVTIKIDYQSKIDD